MASSLRSAVLRHIQLTVAETLTLNGSKLSPCSSARSMSSHGDDHLTKEEVIDRVLDVVKSFPKVDPSKLQGVIRPGCARSSNANRCTAKEVLEVSGASFLSTSQFSKESIRRFQSPFQLRGSHGADIRGPCFARTFASTASEQERWKSSQDRKDISKVEDPFDAPTYNIPEKPVTFTEGASYSVIILAGLGIAAAAGYAVFKELIFEPKEYKIFGKALERIQNDSQVRVRIGSPVTGYGQESRNRAARQRVPHRTWTDEDGVEHVEVNFYVRGPQGAGKVYTEMFKNKSDKQWKFTYLIVEIKSPSPAQLMLESYVPT